MIWIYILELLLQKELQSVFLWFIFPFWFSSSGLARVISYFFLILDRVHFIKYDSMRRWTSNGDKLKKTEIKLSHLIKFDECAYILY